LLKTQPSDSSDFDSSDSDNDSSADEATLQPIDLKSVTNKAGAVSGPALTNDQEAAAVKVTVKEEEPAPRPASAFGSALSRGPAVAGSALRKAADGSLQAPRVVVRRKKVVEEEPESEDGDVDEDDGEEDDDDDDEDAEDEDDAEEDEDDDDESDSDDGDEDEEEFEGTASGKKRAFGFKAWALAQMGQDTAPSAPDLLESHSTPIEPAPGADGTSTSTAPIPKSEVTGPSIGPMGGTFSVPSENLLAQAQCKVSEGQEGRSARPTITRRPSVSESRMDLPIMAEEQAIIEAIRLNSAVVICGETGSGKTTQVPQMLYEAGFGYAGSGMSLSSPLLLLSVI
jgi:ATP-dependent RNA helicase DHX37/DHR1